MSSPTPGSPGGAFPRPTTRFNRAVEWLLGYFSARGWDPEELAVLQRRAVDDLVALGASREPAELAVHETEWEISTERAPPDAWGGEVLRDGDGDRPRVVLYQDSALTRVGPGFGWAAQLTVDHMLGHLYEYHRGADDWGEEVACRWQFRLLRKRGGIVNNVAAVIVAVANRLHKNIPLSNYR
jgi:hypothetical protein